MKPVVKELERRFGRSVYTTKNEVTLEEAVVKLLKKHDLTVSTVESCTGGLAAGRLVNVPGVSDVFKAGFITYSNKAKRKLVGVRKGNAGKIRGGKPGDRAGNGSRRGKGFRRGCCPLRDRDRRAGRRQRREAGGPCIYGLFCPAETCGWNGSSLRETAPRYGNPLWRRR